MSAQPARRHLQLVDGETGEIVDSRELADMQAALEKAQGDLKAAERDLRAKRRRITELEANKARERLEHPRYADAVRVAKYWWRRCRASNPRVNYRTPDRLDAVLALMEIEEIIVDADTKKRRREAHYSMAQFKAAVDGAEFDPFITTHRNGKQERHNDLSQICKDATRFDRAIAKCPYDYTLVDLTPRNAHTDGEVPSTLAGSTREQARSEGSNHGSSSVGGRVVRGPLHREGRWPVFRRLLAVGVDAQPA